MTGWVVTVWGNELKMSSSAVEAVRDVAQKLRSQWMLVDRYIGSMDWCMNWISAWVPERASCQRLIERSLL